MSQTDARAGEPWYTGIGVVFDPGVGLVRWGLILCALGTILVFLVLPLRGGGRDGEEAA